MTLEPFAASFVSRIAGLKGVQAVTLGGSRAVGNATESSDWDFALYYRGEFDPDEVRRLGLHGVVFDVGAWGGGIMNGGAWLTVAGQRVDLHYRDLDDVEHWWHEAQAGRYEKQVLPFYVAGIPTYTVVAELAVGIVLDGDLPRPSYPEKLKRSAGNRWREDARLSIDYACRALVERDDATVAIANASRALLELAHSRAAFDGRWVLNEKGLAAQSGLGPLGDALAFAADRTALLTALRELQKAALSG